MRKVSGWNVFQREKIGNSGVLDPSAFKAKLADVAREWRSLPFDEKQSFEVQANFEEQQQHEAQQAALPPKISQDATLGKADFTLPPSRLKKISMARLQNNFNAERNHVIWTAPQQLGDCTSEENWQFLNRFESFILAV